MTVLRAPMLAALGVATAVHLLLLLGVGFELPEPPPAAVRALEVMTVEQPPTAAASPQADAVRAQVDRAGETRVPLPEVASGTSVDGTEPVTAPDLSLDLSPDLSPELNPEPTPAPAGAPPAAPVSAGGEARPAPPASGAGTPGDRLRRTLLDDTPKAMAQILTGLGPGMALPTPPTAATALQDVPDASPSDVYASRTAEIAALTERISARKENRAGRPRRKAISTNTKEYRYASYMEAWRRKVERIGNLNYPKAARELGLFGSLILHVVVRADGELVGVRVVRSSGHDVLDQAAVHIVELAAPFAPFPDSIAAETDVLDITRVWQFQRNHRLGWD